MWHMHIYHTYVSQLEICLFPFMSNKCIWGLLSLLGNKHGGGRPPLPFFLHFWTEHILEPKRSHLSTHTWAATLKRVQRKLRAGMSPGSPVPSSQQHLWHEPANQGDSLAMRGSKRLLLTAFLKPTNHPLGLCSNVVKTSVPVSNSWLRGITSLFSLSNELIKVKRLLKTFSSGIIVWQIVEGQRQGQEGRSESPNPRSLTPGQLQLMFMEIRSWGAGSPHPQKLP